jgi:2'-hydroxyisoflavone reductase
MRLMPDRSIIVRPTSIVGDRDDEMTMVWWLWRMRHGGRILAPGDGSDAVQWIDVKDVGRFIVALIERGVAGSFNAVGPSAAQETFGEMIRTMFKGYGKVADLVWVPKDFLYGLGLKSATDLPLWRPSSEWGSFYKLSAMKSVQSGLRYRSEQRTFADVLGGYDAAHEGSPHPYLVKSNRGISAERESMVLTAWAQARCVSGNKCR